MRGDKMKSIYRINIDEMDESNEKLMETYLDINRALSEFIEVASKSGSDKNAIVRNLFLLDLVKQKNGTGGESITVSDTLFVDEDGDTLNGVKVTSTFTIPEYSVKPMTVSLIQIDLE